MVILTNKKFFFEGNLYVRCLPVLAEAFVCLLAFSLSISRVTDDGKFAKEWAPATIICVITYFLYVNWKWLRPYKQVTPTVYYLHQQSPIVIAAPSPVYVSPQH